MKRVLLLLAILAFASSAFANSIVNGPEGWGYADGLASPSSTSVGTAHFDNTFAQFHVVNLTRTSGRFGTGNLGGNVNYGMPAGSLSSSYSNSKTALLPAHLNSAPIVFGFSITPITGTFPKSFMPYGKISGYLQLGRGVGGRFAGNRHRGATVPEPGTLGLLGIGLVFVGGMVRRKQKVG
jgi:hypothetical protein